MKMDVFKEKPKSHFVIMIPCMHSVMMWNCKQPGLTPINTGNKINLKQSSCVAYQVFEVAYTAMYNIFGCD